MDGINPSHMDDYWREYEAKRDITGTVVNNPAYDLPYIISIFAPFKLSRNSALCKGIRRWILKSREFIPFGSNKP